MMLPDIHHMIVQSNSTILFLSNPEFPSNLTSLETVHVNLVLYHFNRKTKCRDMWSDYMYEFACKVCDYSSTILSSKPNKSKRLLTTFE